MRLVLIAFFIALIHISHAQSQSSQVDSLQQLIDREVDARKKIKLLNELSFALFDIDVERSNASTEKALSTSIEIGDKHEEGWALTYRGLYFLLSGILPDAKLLFEESLSIGREVGDANLQIYSIIQIGNVYRDKGLFDSAAYFYRQAESESIKNKNDYYRSVLDMNLGRYFLTIHEPDSALRVIQSAIKLREPLKDSVLLADSWILIGNCFREKDDFKEAEKYYQKAFGSSHRNELVHADYLQNIGEIFFKKGDFQLALENWSEVLAHHRKNQYKYALAELLLRMASAFEEQGYYELANEYLVNAMRVAQKAGYQYLIGKIYNELGWVYYRSLSFEIALTNNINAENIFKKIKVENELAGCWDLRGLIERNLKNYDTALFYHQKSLAKRISQGSKSETSDGYFNLGEFYLKVGKPETALPHYVKSLAIDREIGAAYGVSLNSNRIGRIYTKLGRYDSAKLYLDKSLALAIPISSNDIFRDSYYDLGNYYEKTGQLKTAIFYYKKYNQMTDSIFSKQTVQGLASYRTLYDVERNDQKIELLNKDNQLAKALVSRQQLILYTAVAGFIGIVVLAGFYYRFNKHLRRLNASLAEKNEEIQTQAEELAENNQIISEANENLEGKIETRTSELKQAYNELDTFFYRSSHDFRRPLTTFMGLAEVAKITVKDQGALELFEKVNETAHNLDKMLMKLQSISDLGVQEIVYKEISIEKKFRMELDLVSQELLQKNIRTEVIVESNLAFYSYPALVQIIVENLIENSISFCSRNDAFILLKAYKKLGEIVIEVEDNGIGMEQEHITKAFDMYFRGTEHSKGNGLGLYIVKKAAEKLKARVELQSQIGKGTKVFVYFPPNLGVFQATST